MEKRVNVYIDGFNLYHSALQKRISRDKKGKQQHRWPQFRWLDLMNIAVKLLEDAFIDDFESALIVSGDSDLIPAVETLKKMFPVKRVGLVLPPYQKGVDIISRVDYVKKITSDDLKASVLPNEITFAGNKIESPKDWLPKPPTDNNSSKP